MTKEDAKKIILGTGSYEDVKCGNTVSVTGDGGNAWNYFGPAYKKLAPKLVTYVPYSEKYKKLLELKKDLLMKQEYINYRKGNWSSSLPLIPSDYFTNSRHYCE